jgi:WD40 repeat protein
VRHALQFARVSTCLLAVGTGLLTQAHSAPAAEKPASSRKITAEPEAILQLAHVGPVQAVAFSPNGLLVASGGDDGAVKIWEARSGTILRSLTGHARGVTDVIFSPDGTLLLTAGRDRYARLWNVSTGALNRTLGRHTEYLTALAYAPDGKTAATAGGGAGDGRPSDEVAVWDLSTGARLRTIDTPERVHSLSYTADGTSLYSAGGKVQNGKSTAFVRSWDVKTGKERTAFRADGPTIESLTISPGATIAAGGAADGTLWIWDLAGGQLRQRLAAHARTINAVAFAADSRTIATAGDDGVLALWDTFTGKLKRRLKTPDTQVMAVAFSADGKRLATGTLEPDENSGGARVWDAKSGGLKWAKAGRGVRIDAVALSQDGKHLATGGDDGPVRVWDLRELLVRRLREPHTAPPRTPVRGVAFSTDGKTLASTRGDHQVELWDRRSWRLTRRLGDEMTDVRALTFSPDGSVVSCGGKMGLQPLVHWNVETGITARRQMGPSQVFAVAYSPDGKWVAAGCPRGATVWDAETADQRQFLSHPAPHVAALAFTPDGKTLATAGGETVRVWDVARGGLTRELTGHTEQVDAVAISPDGRQRRARPDDPRLGRAHRWAASRADRPHRRRDPTALRAGRAAGKRRRRWYRPVLERLRREAAGHPLGAAHHGAGRYLHTLAGVHAGRLLRGRGRKPLRALASRRHALPGPQV